MGSAWLLGANCVRAIGRSGPEKRKDPSCPEGSWEVPYRAGKPARNWHLAGALPVGCRGFNGPVPPPLWISALFGCAEMVPQAERLSKRRAGRRSACQALQHRSAPLLGRLDRVERVQVEVDDPGRRIGDVRRQALE